LSVINENKKRALVVAAATTVMLLLFGSVLMANTTAAPPVTTVAEGCATSKHFYAYNVAENFFGPASVTTEVAAQKSELHYRRCSDPALAVAHEEYQAGIYSSPQERLAKTQALIDNPDAWRLTVMSLETLEQACFASLETMSGSYQTLWMSKGSTPNDIPVIFQASPEKPQYQVLRFACPNAQLRYKLDCGFQPVAVSFVGIPAKTQEMQESPRPARPSSPPASVPSSPPTTASGCPAGYNCKDPAKGIGNNPAACGLGDCGPRPVNPTPPPADLVVPTATIAPPQVTLPPPAPLAPRPTQTTPVPVPSTAPG